MANPDNQDYIILIKLISATGEVHPPLLVLKSASILKKQIINELNHRTMLIYSDIGYLNDEISYAQIYHFKKFI